MLKGVIITVVCIIAVLILAPVAVKLMRGNDAGETSNPVSIPSDGTPVAVSMKPANGASDVDPGLMQLTVTFSVPMQDGFSWTGGGDKYPEGTGKPYWSADKRTCTLPVRLKPNWSYRLGLNSKSYKNFSSLAGKPLTPVTWTFSTKN